ncbi:MAG: hypothetical protein ACO2Y5_00695 [Nitrosopumilaceae archaeon]|uniref:Uncharacterized protein n=1 Tax=Candidatus Nitrosomaritimum aestuariumsis TaxID=3342354 RepID=A0AC60W3Y7_9ARCH|nr:hypothetical protein [Nitrosopumilaceae archaeon]
MKICSVCHKISGSGQDHLDCIQKRRVELEDEDFKSKITEKLELSKNPQDLGVEVKAILEHLAREKDSKD